MDRAKGGVKRSLLTEASGIPVGIIIERANRHDVKLVEETLESIPITIELKRLAHLAAQKCEQGLCMDAGYVGPLAKGVAEEFGYTTHIRPRGEEKKAREAGKKARRWVVERTHSWLNRYRRLLIRWEKEPQNYLAFLHFACALVTWNQCLFG